MKGTRLYLELFKVFADLAETKSFSQAAARNFITQSAVSQQIAYLEKLLGKRLIDRGKGRLNLTEAGTILLTGCHKIRADYQDILDQIHHQPQEISGSLKVETVYSIGLHSLAPYVRSFLRRYPKVELQVEYKRSDQIIQDVLQGACELGIVAYPSPLPLLDISIFMREKLTLVCYPEHPFAKRKSVRLSDLEGENFVTFSSDIPTRRAIDRELRRAGAAVRIVHEMDNIETLKRSVEIGAGISILPETTIKQEVRDGTLKRVPIAAGSLFRPIGLLRARRRTASRAVQEFTRWLRCHTTER